MTAFRPFKMHLSRFTDRPIFRDLDKVKLGYFGKTGGAIRKTAKRSLRRAAQVKVSDMTSVERAKYAERMASFKAGKLKTKPRRREKIAAPGAPPVLHMQPKSPLRELLLYSIDDSEKSVVVGPAQFKGGNLAALENSNPFMAPAMAKIEPQFPSFLAAAAGKS